MSESTPLTVVTPASVEAWYHMFARNDDTVIFVGESNDDTEELVDLIAHAAAGRPIRILSGHDSLLRDFVIASKLRAGGHVVSSQSGLACAAGVDKLLQKRLLGAAGIAVPRWGVSDNPSDNGALLLKRREATQSRGLGWYGATPRGNAHSYWEQFVAGTEYSVVLHRESGATSMFPVVWKGEARTDLLPPWRRLRTVPSGLDDEAATRLQRIAHSIADLVEAWGFIEVEFIVPAGGAPVVTDVNPRVCGTMRLVAMATEVPIFDWQYFSSPGDRRVDPAKYAAEVPYDGGPIASPNLVATSRLTCSGADAMSVRATIRKYATNVHDHIYDWPDGWHEH